MRIETKLLSDLNPAPYNPRVDLQPGDPEYEKLRNSIERYGMVDVLVWNERTGNLVGGHQRYKILKEMGEVESFVSVVDLDEEDEKALNIALNKIQGDWDYSKLITALGDLKAKDYPIDLTGFSNTDYTNLLNQYKEPILRTSEDDLVPEATESKTRLGDLWKLDPHFLLCGDATDYRNLKKLMYDKKASLLFTDPPYGINVVGSSNKVGGGSKGVPSRKVRPIKGDDTQYNLTSFLGMADKCIIWGG